ncbi:TonB-dependent receptor domain-containing protein [Sphingomonas sp.]|uniref:TonB-dependent receptor domain-containing protein n=1 Tax=Sphingomonas sp. TaxID=28214 RepID=UPI003B3BAB66
MTAQDLLSRRRSRFSAGRILLATTMLVPASAAVAQDGQQAAPAAAVRTNQTNGPATNQQATGASPDVPDEIVVTANKRAENIQKVPISMQALGNETLEQHQVQSFDDYTKLLPSVSYQTYGPSQQQLTFRGVATGGIDLPGGALSATGVYLDEIPITTTGALLDVHVYDVARVEALAGPQGTLFGASSLAGTLRIITNKPDPSKFAAGYDLEGNKFGKGNAGGSAEGFVNIPLSESAAVRIVGYYQHDGGYIDNTPGQRTYTLSDDDPSNDKTVNNSEFVKKNFNDVDTYGGRIALAVDLNDNWTVTPSLVAQHQLAHGTFGFDPRVGDLEVHEFAPDRNLDKWYQAALTVEGKIGNFDLVYSGGYLQRSIDNDQDYSYYTVYYDNIPGYTHFPDGKGGFLDPTQRYHNHQALTKQTHELRISSPSGERFRVTAGLFYQRQANRNVADYFVPGLGSIPNSPAVIGDDIFVTRTHIVNRDYAAFAQASLDLTDTLTLTGGIRGFKAHNTLMGFSGFASNAESVGCTVPITAGCVNVDKSYKQSGETHKVSLDWNITPTKMVYATYSTGFRPGGNNRRPGIDPYKADTLDNYEIGWKTNWFDRKLRWNTALFYERWNNVQYALAPVGAVGVANIYNVGKANIYGIETDASAYIGALTLSGSAAYTDAKLGSDFCSIGTDGNPDCTLGTLTAPKGTRLPVQPKFKGTATARYQLDIAGHPSFLQGTILHQSGVRNFLGLADDDAVGDTRGFTTFDFSAGIRFSSLSFEAFITNAFDKRGILSRNTFCVPTYCGQYARSYPVKPQQFGIKMSQRF